MRTPDTRARVSTVSSTFEAGLKSWRKCNCTVSPHSVKANEAIGIRTLRPEIAQLSSNQLRRNICFRILRCMALAMKMKELTHRCHTTPISCQARPPKNHNTVFHLGMYFIFVFSTAYWIIKLLSVSQYTHQCLFASKRLF